MQVHFGSSGKAIILTPETVAEWDDLNKWSNLWMKGVTMITIDPKLIEEKSILTVNSQRTTLVFNNTDNGG